MLILIRKIIKIKKYVRNESKIPLLKKKLLNTLKAYFINKFRLHARPTLTLGCLDKCKNKNLLKNNRKHMLTYLIIGFQRLGSVFASELPLVFGAPFHDPTIFQISSSNNSPAHSSLTSYQKSTGARDSSFPSGSRSSSSQFGSGREFAAEFQKTGNNKHVAWVAPSNFSRNDALVSEIIMKLWTNFAKSG